MESRKKDIKKFENDDKKPTKLIRKPLELYKKENIVEMKMVAKYSIIYLDTIDLFLKCIMQ